MPTNYVNAVSDLSESALQRLPSGMTLSVAAADEEPVSVPDAQDFLRLDRLPDPTVLQTVIAAVREQAEKHVGRLFTRREVTLTWRKFFGETDLPFPPLGSVTDVEVYDDGSFSSLDPSDYRLRGRRLEVDTFRAGETAQVTYQAGYQSLPHGLKLQMLQDIRAAYDHRDMYEGQSLSDGEILTRSAYEQWSVRR